MPDCYRTPSELIVGRVDGDRDLKIEKMANIILDNYSKTITKLLIIGCGTGVEAIILSKILNTQVIGLDLIDNFETSLPANVILKTGDCRKLEFADLSFDFVFSNHSLEHIIDPHLALSEICRVLKPGGGIWIGTPNRRRLIGSMSSKTASLREKIRLNCEDWKAKCLGKFKNELGAHAGFTDNELLSLMNNAEFSNIKNLTNCYYQMAYYNHKYIVKTIKYLCLKHYLFPALYFLGEKK